MAQRLAPTTRQPRARRARAALEDRQRALAQWPALIALVEAAVPGAARNEAAGGEAPSGVRASAPVEGGG